MAQRITVSVAEHSDVEPIELGHQGENLATTVEFDISAWMDTYGTGTVALLNQRKGETPYPVIVTQKGSIVSWLVTGIDTGKPGTGWCELQYYIGDVLVKSDKWRTITKESMEEAGDPPEPWDGFLDQVAELAAVAEDAASSAESSKTVATEQADRAETAQSAAEAAKASAEQSAAGAEAAKTAIDNSTATGYTLPAGSDVRIESEVVDGVKVWSVYIPRGDKGEKGDTGDPFRIMATYASIAEMETDYSNPDVEIGNFVIIASDVEDPDNAKLYVKIEKESALDSGYRFITDLSGATGIQGERGATGAHYTPQVSSDGDLSWTNDGGLDNPATVNIKGPQGDTGVTFTPAVSAEGVLSWSNDGGRENPAAVDLAQAVIDALPVLDEEGF